jgi:hypothetical protein
MVIINKKRFKAMKLIDGIMTNPVESRKECIDDVFENNGQRMKSYFHFQFGQREKQSILLNS